MVTIHSENQISSIEIFNIFGQLVAQNHDKSAIDLSGLNTGIYFCKVTDIHGAFGVLKVVKE